MRVRIMFKVTAIIFVFLSFACVTAHGFTDLSNCLVTNDIGIFTYKSQYSHLGSAPGVVGGADHFELDHNDSICSGTYSKNVDVSGLSKKEKFKVMLSVDVEVTQHAGADSDKWLLHEIEKGIRRGNYEENMTSSRFRNIDGNNIFYSGLGGGTYRWISNYKVINIEYTDLYKQKQEPLEVIKAYLGKFPSTIPALTIDKAHNEAWIKDEMERRLWLCDKWSMQLQLGKVSQADMLQELVDHMTIFLNYRQKYFGVSATDEIAAINTYLFNHDGTSIKKKLTDYKTWWAKHKEKGIRL